jgi:hypothetical protein
MAFYICKKCKAGCHVDVGEEVLRVMGFSADGRHRPGECDGEVEVVSDQRAGAGPGYVPPAKESN